jgi:phosphoribosylanthranilate isomerase
MRTRVKICGITRPVDGQAAARAGADAIGLVFYAKSPRYVELAQAQAICAALPPFVSVVALFVDAARDQVQRVLDEVPVDLLQFHGQEDAAYCERFGAPYVKTIAMAEGVDTEAAMRGHPAARGFLFDAHQPDTHGGGGRTFNWSAMPADGGRALILAGGLTPDNVAAAIEQSRPFAVDVSSGVEVEKGIKSADRIEAFMRGVQRGDASQASR